MKRFPSATRALMAVTCQCPPCGRGEMTWPCASAIEQGAPGDLRRWLFDEADLFGVYKMPVALSLSLDGCAVEDLP